MTTSALINKLWGYCNLLRDAGMSYMQYITQITYLLFLKMADELTKPPYNRPARIPKEYDWNSLLARDGDELEHHYREVLTSLGKEKGMLGVIFQKAQNEISDPAKLRRLIVDLIDKEKWFTLEADVKGAAYEGLLQKNAEDTKSGAGQYFTPRPLIQAIVDCMRPESGMTICDPACGTGGFLLAAHDYIVDHYTLDPDQARHLKLDALRGVEIAPDVVRLCVMNMYLHGIGDKESPISRDDALVNKPSYHYDMVLTNPPFGKKSSVTISHENGKESKEKEIIERDDFWATTSNKQLNFVQHVVSILKQHGTAAMVLPDNVLFEGGAGQTIREQLLKTCDVHTLLRLPTGIFYRPGVKANVLFFDRKPGRPEPWTETLWIYDFRTNQHFTLKQKPLGRDDLEDFVTCYNTSNRHDRKETERFKPFPYADLLKRDKTNLDIFWLKDESLEDAAKLPDPDIIAQDIKEDLQAALDAFDEILKELEY